MHDVRRLLALLAALLLFGVTSAQLSVKVASPTSFDLTTRFLETIRHQKPDAFYPFLRELQQYQIRPKVKFSDPAFRSSKTLEGKTRPSKYANHNPVFTLLAQPFEAFQALESSFHRSRLWRGRGSGLVWNTALANDVALPALVAMAKVSEEREAAIDGAKGKACVSWIDVSGQKACSGEDFWKVAGRKQMFLRDPVKVESSSPELYPFDRLLPKIRDESLPLIVLYASATDEAFPTLFDFLHKLAQPANGHPRIQLALRWKLNRDDETTFRDRFDVNAHLESSTTFGSTEDVSSRATALIDQSDDKLAALARVAASLPLLEPELAAIQIPESIDSIKDVIKDNNIVTLNHARISNDAGISSTALLDAMRIDSQLLSDLASTPYANEALAAAMLLNSSLTLEEPKQGSKGPVFPTAENPLDFVNLVEACNGVPPLVTRGSYIEADSDEDNDIDPPALATIYLIADLESPRGRQQAKEALKFLDATSRVRFAFFHRPTESTPESTKAPHAFSSLLYSLVASKQLAEVYPSELLAFLNLEIGPNGPKRSLDDVWTQENPITPFLEKGLTQEELEGEKEYLQDVKTFVHKLGVRSDGATIIINGRVIRLGDSVMSSGSLRNLFQYELKRRIRSVAEATLAAATPKLAQDRAMQAEVFNLAVSVLASSGVKNRGAKLELPSSIPSIEVNGSAFAPMFNLEAVLDPVSPFARRVIPILSTLAKDPLFTVKIYLAPTSTKPSDEELRTLYGTAFSTRLSFDEEKSLQQLDSVVGFDGVEKGSEVKLSATIDGQLVDEKQIVVDGKKQTLVLEHSHKEKVVKGKEQAHSRDEL